MLIKSVAQAIPTYAMQVFSIPNGILFEIEKMIRGFFWGQRASEKKISWVAWDKLTFSKDKGGMGFRDVQDFNKAMLAKQAWRLLTKEDSLMFKVLKGKYFPKCGFLEAKHNSSSSFTWKSILLARNLLSKGVRKVVGNGASINIWTDPWVPSLHGFKLDARGSMELDQPGTVNELIVNGHWNTHVMQNWLTNDEVAAIKKIPISASNLPDFWSWHFSKNGEYSVRTAYQVELEEKRKDKDHGLPNLDSKAWKRL